MKRLLLYILMCSFMGPQSPYAFAAEEKLSEADMLELIERSENPENSESVKLLSARDRNDEARRRAEEERRRREQEREERRRQEEERQRRERERRREEDRRERERERQERAERERERREREREERRREEERREREERERRREEERREREREERRRREERERDREREREWERDRERREREREERRREQEREERERRERERERDRDRDDDGYIPPAPPEDDDGYTPPPPPEDDDGYTPPPEGRFPAEPPSCDDIAPESQCTVLRLSYEKPHFTYNLADDGSKSTDMFKTLTLKSAGNEHATKDMVLGVRVAYVQFKNGHRQDLVADAKTLYPENISPKGNLFLGQLSELEIPLDEQGEIERIYVHADSWIAPGVDAFIAVLLNE